MAVIKLKRSDTPGNTPTTLEHGEVAINIADKKIYIGSGDTNDTAVLIVDGNAIGGSTSTETIQDAAASLFTSGTHVGISVSYPDTNNAINLTNTGVLSFNSRTGAVSLTSSDVTTALGYTPQRQEPTLTAIANLSPDADDLIYFSGTDGAAITTLTSFGRSLIDDLNASAARTTLGLAIGTNVQAWDADLDAIAALSGTSGVLKKTAANTWSLDTANLDDLADVTITSPAANQLLYYNSGSSLWVNASASTIGLATLTGSETLTNKILTSPTITSPTISNLYLSDGLILVEGTTNDTNEMSLVVGTLTADRTITLPDTSGTVITTGNLTSITSTGTISSGTWNGTAIGTVYGGTGLTSFTSGGILFASSSSALTTGTVFDIDSTSNVYRINIASGATPKATQEFKVSESAFNSSAAIGVYTDVGDNPPGSLGQAYVNLASTIGTDSQIVLASGVGSVTFAGGTTPLSLTATPSLWGSPVGVLYCIDHATNPYIIFGDDGTNNSTSIKITDTLSTMVVTATTLKINTSTPVAGKILTCTDSNGTVSWEDNAAADMILFSMGFI